MHDEEEQLGHQGEEGEGSGQRPDKGRKGRRDKRPTPQPESDDDEADDKQFDLLSEVNPAPCNNQPEAEQNPLPCPRMRISKTIAYGSIHEKITSTEISGSARGRMKTNKSDML